MNELLVKDYNVELAFQSELQCLEEEKETI